MQIFQTVTSCLFLVKVVSKASLNTVLDLQFFSWKLSLIRFLMLWRINSQSLIASKFQLVGVKQLPTLLSLKEWITLPMCRYLRQMQVFETEFSVHVTFKGMCKCFSVYQPALRVKMTWLYWVCCIFGFRIENGFPDHEIFPSKPSIARDWQLTCCVISVNYNQNPLPITGINEFCRFL